MPVEIKDDFDHESAVWGCIGLFIAGMTGIALVIAGLIWWLTSCP
ncbi:hypothetical protein [Bradyrhizobium sp.]